MELTNNDMNMNQEQHTSYIYPQPSKTMYTIYSKSNCKYCEKVKDYFADIGFEYNIILCDDFLVKNKVEFLEFIESMSGIPYNTFPIVFHKGGFVGGYNDTLKYCAFQ
jgi:glutaredoxin